LVSELSLSTGPNRRARQHLSIEEGSGKIQRKKKWVRGKVTIRWAATNLILTLRDLLEGNLNETIKKDRFRGKNRRCLGRGEEKRRKKKR